MNGQKGAVTSDTLLQIIGIKEVEIFMLKQQMSKVENQPDLPQDGSNVDIINPNLKETK